MKNIFIILFLFCSMAAAKSQPGHAHREKGTHKHGIGEILIAFDGLNGNINFKAPGESIYGFEHKAKKVSDQKKQDDALLFLQKNISEMIRFEQSLKCVVTKDKFEMTQPKGEKHSDLDAAFSVVCEKSLMDSTLIFNLQTTFPKLKHVSVKVIVDDLQKSGLANKNGAKLELTK